MINFILISEKLAVIIHRCKIYKIEYGLNYKTIKIIFYTKTLKRIAELKLLFKNVLKNAINV